MRGLVTDRRELDWVVEAGEHRLLIKPEQCDVRVWLGMTVKLTHRVKRGWRIVAQVKGGHMLSDLFYVVDMADGSRWAIPVNVIALDRARHYISEFEDNLQRSLSEDTVPLFNESPDSIADWAQNNMNWDEVVGSAVCIKQPGPPDYQDGWVNGAWELITGEPEKTDDR